MRLHHAQSPLPTHCQQPKTRRSGQILLARLFAYFITIANMFITDAHMLRHIPHTLLAHSLIWFRQHYVHVAPQHWFEFTPGCWLWTRIHMAHRVQIYGRTMLRCIVPDPFEGVDFHCRRWVCVGDREIERERDRERNASYVECCIINPICWRKRGAALWVEGKRNQVVGFREKLSLTEFGKSTTQITFRNSLYVIRVVYFFFG